MIRVSVYDNDGQENPVLVAVAEEIAACLKSFITDDPEGIAVTVHYRTADGDHEIAVGEE